VSDTITPPPGKDAATALWEIASYMSRYREPLVPVVLTLARETPALIQDALRAEVRKTGGDLQLMTSRARTPDHPEARQVVAWIVAQLKLEPHRRQYLIVSTSNAGGAGKTSTVMHLCLQLARLGLRVLVVDLDISQGALATFFRVDPTAYEAFTTLPDEYPDLVTTYPLALVERRIVLHASGLDLLFAG
jgi:Mrp family chromosome partitioning ATPase